jgi:hypothetical protein
MLHFVGYLQIIDVDVHDEVLVGGWFDDFRDGQRSLVFIALAASLVADFTIRGRDLVAAFDLAPKPRRLVEVLIRRNVFEDLYTVGEGIDHVLLTRMQRLEGCRCLRGNI